MHTFYLQIRPVRNGKREIDFQLNYSAILSVLSFQGWAVKEYLMNRISCKVKLTCDLFQIYIFNTAPPFSQFRLYN